MQQKALKGKCCSTDEAVAESSEDFDIEDEDLQEEEDEFEEDIVDKDEDVVVVE